MTTTYVPRHERPSTRKTKQILVEMLTENTGRHMCDSGGAYGRNWERNQGKTIEDFEKRQQATLHVGRYPCHGAVWKGHETVKPHLEFSVTMDVYHFLADRLAYDGPMQRRLERFAKRKDQQEESWFGVLNNWLEAVKAVGPEEGSRGDEPVTVNSYNHEDALSQVVQYTVFRLPGDDTEYIALSIHGGCDVRGGYTKPRIFTISGSNSDDWYTLTNNARYTIGAWDEPTGTETHWDFNDNQFEQGEWSNHRQDVQVAKEFGRTGRFGSARYGDLKALEQFPFEEVDRLPEEPRQGVIYVIPTDEGRHDFTAYCPLTHRPLEAWAFPG